MKSPLARNQPVLELLWLGFYGLEEALIFFLVAIRALIVGID